MTDAAPPRPAEPEAVDPVARRLTSAGAWIALLVVVAGANVTSTKSGDAIPTWPWGWLGDTAATRIEATHRYVALLLIVTTGVAAWRTGRPGLKRLAWVIFGLVVVQALLGGWRVLVGAEDESHPSLPWLKVTHATLGQAIYPLAVAAAGLASAWWAAAPRRPVEDAGLAVMRAAGLALLSFLVQILLGALGRHDVLPREVHSVFALVPLALAARLVLALADVPKGIELLQGPAALLGFLTAAQLVLGVASYIVVSQTEDPLQRGLAEVVALNAHVGVSAALTGVAVSIALRAVRIWGAPTDERIAEARAAAAGGPPAEPRP